VFNHGDYGVELLDLKDVKVPQRIALRARSIDLAFMGIGALEPTIHKSLFGELLDRKGLSREELREAGVIGNILFHLISETPGPSWQEYELPPEKRIAVDIDDPTSDDTLHVLSLDILRELVEIGGAQIVVLAKNPTRARIIRAALELRCANTV